MATETTGKTATRSWRHAAGHAALALAIAGGTAAALVSIHAAESSAPAAGAETRPTPVVARTAVARDGFEAVRRFTGLVEAETVVELGFEIDGRVVEAGAKLGQRVEAGAVLGRLDTERLEAQRRQLAARLDEARATLDFRRAEFERAERLLEQGSGTRQRFDEARSDLAVARATVDDLDAQLESVTLDLGDATLEAPFDGVVLEKSFARGDVVSPGRAVLRLMASESLEARIGVPVGLARGFEEGESVDLLWRGRETRGRVERIVPEIAARSRTATLVVSLGRDLDPIAGETVTLLARERIEAPGFWVPLGALVADLKGLWAVQVAREGEDGARRIARAPVRVIHTDGERAYVAGALSAGDPIVTEGTNRVSPGELVALADDAPAR